MGPLFSGTFQFVRLFFSNGQGFQASVSGADMQTLIQWATLAVAPISTYESRFGPNRLGVSPTPITHEVPPPPAGANSANATYYWDSANRVLRYGRDDLYQWLDPIFQNLAADVCLVIPNPYYQSVVFTDCDPSKSLWGIHGWVLNPKLASYHRFFCFCNVGQEVPYDVPDSKGQYGFFLSHEIAEHSVNPGGAAGNPEVCDTSAGQDFFDAAGNYMYSACQWPNLPPKYGFYIASPAVPAKDLCVVANQAGLLSVFYTGLDDVLYRSSQLDPGGWPRSERALLLGKPTNKAKQVAAACNNDGRLEVFYIGTDDVLYHNWQMTAGNEPSWSGEILLGNSLNTAKQVAVGSNKDTRLEVFFIGTDDVLYHQWQLQPVSGTGWSNSVLFEGSTNKAKQLLVAQNQDGRLEVFYIGIDDVLYHDWQTAPVSGTPWSGSMLLYETEHWAKQIAVGKNSDGRLELFFIGLDGVIYHDWQTAANNGWNGATVLSGSPQQALRLAVAANANGGPLELFYIGWDGKLYHMRQQPSAPDGWSAPQALVLAYTNETPQPTTITVAVNSDGRMEIFYTDSNQLLLHSWQMQAGGATGWRGNNTLWCQQLPGT